MKDYLINTPVTLRDGIVRLSPEMAKGREHKLEPVKGKKDHYRITAPNQFKAGQKIGYEGDLPKSMAENMTEKNAAEAAAKKAAEKEAAEKKAAEKEAAEKKAAEKEAAEKKAAEKEAAAKSDQGADGGAPKEAAGEKVRPAVTWPFPTPGVNNKTE